VVNGTVSSRDDEIEILVTSVQELIENASYQEKTPTPKENSSATNPASHQQNKPKELPLVIHEGGKLFVRVPSLDATITDKAKNLIALFDGGTEVIFYDTKKGTYSAYSQRFSLTPFTLGEMQALLGEENVIYH